ncbi:ribbon-helix-helix protein, CopG family [Sphingorhabdus lacus]|nr:ribbon-helix-helix protein, CopG family [Sphingorhabdus lacus]
MTSDASSSKMQKRITISLREDQYAGLEEVAEDLGVNLSDAAREAINTFLLKEHWGRTIGTLAESEIKKGMTNEEVLARVMDKFPHARTTKDSIAWYRSRLRREDPEVPTDREAKVRRGAV